MDNEEVSRALDEFAALYGLRGDTFRRNAYSRAARSVEESERDVAAMAEAGTLETLPGVGRGIAGKIGELVSTGASKELEKLRRGSGAAIDLMDVPGVGPRTAMRLRDELDVEDVESLKEAAESGRVRELDGFGPRSERAILNGIAMLERSKGRRAIGYALPEARAIVAYLEDGRPEDRVELAGSLRRMKDTVGDIDVLVATDDPSGAIARFLSYPGASSAPLRGATRASVLLNDGLRADLRAVRPEDAGSAAQYFIGSKEHGVRLRRMAISKGWKLNEYGLFDGGGRRIAGEDQEGIYRALGLQYVPPELREDRGEIEAAREGRLPKLVTLGDVKGDLHVHTSLSDGEATMGEMAMAAKRLGYEYVGLTDHSRSLRIANGLSPERLLRSIDEARRLTDELGITVLRGAEVDILRDGTLDYPRDVLDELDYVIGSVHSGFRMGREEMTSRILTAMSRGIDILGHPTGRALGKRDGYDVDLEAVMDRAAQSGVMMEVNGHRNRMDLNDMGCREAASRGVVLALGTDAHTVEGLESMELAVGAARRGWLEAGNVANTRSLRQLRRLFGRT